MNKKFLLFLLLPIMLVTLSGCIPPFFDGGMSATEYFEDIINYTTFLIDAAEEGGFIESEEIGQPLDYFIDGNEDNIEFKNYRKISFTTKKEGFELNNLAFIVQAEEDCSINLTLFYGENNIASDRVSLQKNTISTVYFSDFSLFFEEGKELIILISNPLEIGTVVFRTDSYIFIGQEV